MNKIFILKSKYQDYYMDASTPELELEAFYTAFLINDSLEYYQDFKDVIKARNGDRISAKRVINLRSGYEYESFSIEELTTSEEWLIE